MAIRFSKTMLLGAVSAASVMVGAAAPALAYTDGTPTTGIYGGGGTLAAVLFRQVFDCYGQRVAVDSSPGTALGAGGVFLNAACTGSTFPYNGADEVLYAAVGSGQGTAAYVSDSSGQLYRSNGAFTTSSIPALLPAVPPAFTDVGAFTSYPYPRLDFAAGDSPLPYPLSALTVTLLNNNTGPGTSASSSAGTAAFNTSISGKPINIPAFETTITLPVNTLTLDNINTKLLQKQKAPASAGGGTASNIQLSRASYCAIFGGKVTNWADNTTTFPADNGTTVTTLGADNGGKPFSNTPVNITVVPRSDGSGTSNIFSQHLKDVCNPLGGGSVYAFSRNTTFQKAYPGSVFPAGAHFNAQSGSGAVAYTVGTTAGAIGYVSPDYTWLYNTSGYVQNGSSTVAPPSVAAVQNQYNIDNGVAHPVSASSFPQPTYANLTLAIPATGTFVPAAGADYGTWDLNPGVDQANNLAGSGVAKAYPIAGFTYLYLYQCYATQAEVTNLFGTTGKVGVFNWYFNKGASTVKKILNANGFDPLPGKITTATTLLGRVYTDFLTGSGTNAVGLAGVNQCANTTGA